MIRALTHSRRGALIVLGVTPVNLERLQAGHPILVDLGDFGVESDEGAVELAITFGPSERAIVAELQAHGVEFPNADETLRAAEAEYRRKGTSGRGTSP